MTHENLEQQLDMHRRTLANLETQIAGQGELEAPVGMLNQRNLTKESIIRLEEQLHLPTSYTKRPPGVLPPVWNVPHSRNLNFTGRGDLLAELEQTDPVAITQAIAGLGGVGKTQLANEYIYRHTADFALVWWVRAENEVSLKADLAELAAELGLEEAKSQEQQKAINAALRWLQSKGTRWLLVLDNVNFPDEVRAYLPQGGDGKVIVTSRYNGDWQGVAKPLQVKVWGKDEAVEFLLKRTGKNEPQAAVELVAELGYLPLALEHAAAYVAKNKAIGLAGYLKHYHEKKLALLKDGKLSQDYHNDTIMTTWKISFEKLDEAARGLFNLCAFLSPDEIPLSLFEMAEDAKKEVALPEALAGLDELGWIETLGKLAEYSLVEIKEQVFTLHRLVQAVGRERLGEEQQKEWASRAARLVSAALTSEVDTDIASWDVYAKLQGHALAIAGDTEQLEVELDITTRLLGEVALYLQIRGDYVTALGLFKRALILVEKTYGLESEKTAVYANNLGLVLKDLGDYAGAKQHLERALRIDELVFGNDHPNIAGDANNLGLVLKALGDLQGARKYIERALRIDELVFGNDHPNVAGDANSLGLLLKDLGELQEAKQCLERALSIVEKQLGENHPYVASSLSNLGMVLQALGDFLGAKVLYERALSFDEKVFGNDHPKVATRANNLGSLLYAQENYAGAKPYFVRALTIRRKFLGEEHPYTIQSKNWMEKVEKTLRKEEGG